MSWLLFCDESGIDHKNTPLEVRGGVAIHTSQIWPFIQGFQKAELDCFGVILNEYGREIKGSKLLSNERYKWAKQEKRLLNNERKNGVRRFLTKKQQKEKLSQRDFTAYGQASLMMAEKIFALLLKHEAVLFASCIPRGAKKPKEYKFEHYLRKDITFAQERFYWFLESKKEHGLLIFDQSEKNADQKFLRRLEDYYNKTRNGKKRAKWVVPTPIFVDSGLSAGVQAADLSLYCINWGFRRPEWKFQGLKRDEIHNQFAGYCGQLQFNGDMIVEDKTHRGFGIIYVPDPYKGKVIPK